MASEAIASYLPDSQLIKIGVNIPAFCDEKNPRGFQGVQELAYVLHEWMHYLHNVSTVHGLSSFTNLIHLWSNFRQTIGCDGFSDGSRHLSKDISSNFHQRVSFLVSARQSRPNRLGGEKRLELVKVISVSNRFIPLPGLEFSTCIIDCQTRHYNEAGEYNQLTVEIGSHEIVESVAYMLERRLIVLAGGTPEEVQANPYRLVELFAKHVAPSLDELEIIICGIAALQDTNPPKSLRQELEFAENEKKAGMSVFAQMNIRQISALSKINQWVSGHLSTIEEIFSLDDSMSRAVKKIVQTIRSNFNYRLNNPFFEIDIVAEVVRSGGDLRGILKTFGACSLLQRCPGSDDEIRRDLIYEFVLDDPEDHIMYEGRQLLRAAFQFIRLHFRNDEVIPTSKIPVDRNNTCQFYTSCGLPTRIDNERVCAEQPWKTAHQPVASLCPYGHAVRLISPEDIAAQLAERYPPAQAGG